MAVMPLVVDEVVAAERLQALGEEWNALADRHGDGLPFRTFEWTAAWWRWFPEASLAVRDALWVRTFRTRAGDLVGIAPMTMVRRPGVGPAALRAGEFVGADPHVTEVPGVLTSPDCEAAVYRALVRDLDHRAGQWDVVRWRGVRAGGDGEQVLRESGGVPDGGALPAYRVPLVGSWEAFRSSRPRNLKESLRRCYNSLRRDGHAFELDVARDPEAVAAALERFLALHAARATAAGFASHGDVFRDPASRAFLLDVCGRLAARDAVRVFQLRIRGEVVAARIGFALGDTLYLYFSGYDPTWAPYSVMTTTVAEAFRYAFASGFAHVHLSTGTDESKLRWRPERTDYLGFALHAKGLRARSARWIFRTLRTMRPDSQAAPARLARSLLGRRRDA